MNYKFTSDGRKVVVVGALNAKETIVQEIFVTDGTEFPAGEHFVVKTLLDSPAETYKAKEERRILEDIRRHEAERDKLESELKGWRVKAAAAVAKIKWIQGIQEPELKDVFDNLKSMLCGEYTHVVLLAYNIEIEEWEPDLFATCEHRRFEKLKMISLYGNWNGRLGLSYNINSYGDGSGGSNRFIPCKSLQEAVKASKAVIYAKPTLSDHEFNFCVKYGIAVDEAKNTARIATKNKRIKEQIMENNKQLAKLEADLMEDE